MLSGAGSPLIDILAGARKGASGGKGFSLLSREDNINQNKDTVGVNDASTIIADLVEISDEARGSLEQGYDALRAAAGTDVGAELLRKRIQQIREELEFIDKLLQSGDVTRDTAGVLGRQIRELGRSLKQVGAQIGAGQDIAVAESRVSVEAISLTYSFNSLAQVELADGSRAEISQSFSLQLDFVRIEAETTVSAAGPGGPGGKDDGSASAIMSDFQVTKQSFRKVLQEFEKNFMDRERLPLNLYNTIRNMIEKAVSSADERTGLLDRTA
jgi:hypothetical protein